MQRGARFFEKKTLSCSVALVLRFATGSPSTHGRTRRDLRESAPMQRGAHFFEKRAFPCSVALKVLGVTSGAARSRIGFSNIWGFVGFYRGASLALWRFVFQYMGLRRFFRVACLVLSRFVFR